MAATLVHKSVGQVVPIVLPLSGQFTATIAGLVKFKVPGQRWLVLRVQAIAQAKGGTHGTTNIDVKNGATSILTTKPDLATPAAGTLVEAVVDATKALFAPDDSLVIDLNQSGGSSPTMNNVTVVIEVLPQD